MRVAVFIVLGLLSSLANANEQVLVRFVNEYNQVPNQRMFLRNIRNHANMWSGWIDRIHYGKHTWGTFIALIDDGEVSYWYTDETSNLLGGEIDAAEAGQAADTITSAVALTAVDAAVELNPLGLPIASVVKYATNEWAESQEFNVCRDTKRRSGRFGWALSGWNLGGLINPVMGVVAALSMYKRGGDMTEDSIGRSCQGWIGPVVIETIDDGQSLKQEVQAEVQVNEEDDLLASS